MHLAGIDRRSLPFRSVNQRGSPAHEAGLQRHHLLPRQLLTVRAFGCLFDAMGKDRLGLDDFRSNGLLLPADSAAAIRIGLPLHRGPHRSYNALVIERVGQIEAGWASSRRFAPDCALSDAYERLTLLQRALRRRLLAVERKPFALNRSDPLGGTADFAVLDAMAAALWPVTEPSG